MTQENTPGSSVVQRGYEDILTDNSDVSVHRCLSGISTLRQLQQYPEVGGSFGDANECRV